MITDATLTTIAETADDTNVLIEIYPSDETPPFDPANAVKRYANVSGEGGGAFSWNGQTYTRLVTRYGRIRRTITEELNRFQFTLSNLTNDPATYELQTGYEGLIVVVREVSRSQSTAADESFIHFTGRLERPRGGDRRELRLEGRQIVGSVNTDIPRRKFQPEDNEGRTPANPLFEGFRFMPQYGTTTYSVRKRRGGLLGLLGFKKTVQKTLEYSSYSDLDAETYVPVVLGRGQVAGTHIAYADIGNTIQAVTAFCEGEIEDFTNIRSDDRRFSPNVASIVKRYGLAGGTGSQVPHPTPSWIGNGYYSRTALMFLNIDGTTIEEVDPAPLLSAVVLGLKIAVPNTGPTDWTSTDWTDDGAAQARHLLTSADYLGLDEAWIDDATFAEVRDYNNEIVFDKTFAGAIWVPPSAGVKTTQLYYHLLPTGIINTNYFKEILASKSKTNAYVQTAFAFEYASQIPNLRPDPDDFPIPGPTQTPNYLYLFLIRRYTSNVVVTERMSVIDFMHEVLFTGFRGFLAQAEDGRIQLKQKKPVDHSFAGAALSGSTIALDDVSPWIGSGNLWGSVLIDPHTSESEVRNVTDADYSTAQNSVAVSGSGNLTITGFSGCDGNETPATCDVTVNSLPTGGQTDISLEGIAFGFRHDNIDTTSTAAALIAYTIGAHPTLKRRFTATWNDDNTFTLTAKFGSLDLDAALGETHVTGLADPTAAPSVVANGSGGNLIAGLYKVGYSYQNARGDTVLSPTITVSTTNNDRLDVSSVSLPAGASNIRWFCSPDGDVHAIRYHSSNDGSAFQITDAPLFNDQVPSEENFTYCQVMRIAMAFTDREEARTNETSSNVLKATFAWSLADREDSVNRIDLKWRDSTQDFRLVELRISDKQNIAKLGKVNNKEYNGACIDNYNQAFRIGAGLLSEEQDHGFLYSGTGDRKARLLQEGDVVAVTDRSAGVVNFPVSIEELELEGLDRFTKVKFTGRKYSITLYDDSAQERVVPVVIEKGHFANFV